MMTAWRRETAADEITMVLCGDRPTVVRSGLMEMGCDGDGMGEQKSRRRLIAVAFWQVALHSHFPVKIPVLPSESVLLSVFFRQT
jgi:hypothetical protein